MGENRPSDKVGSQMVEVDTAEVAFVLTIQIQNSNTELSKVDQAVCVWR